MAIDFESLKDSVIAAVQTGATKAKELAGTGVAKAKELSEISKLKMQNSVEQDAIRKDYAELGKQYYAAYGADPDPALAGLCQKITESMGKISYNNERIADIKAAGGSDPEGAADEAMEKAGDALETAEAAVAEKAEEVREKAEDAVETVEAAVEEKTEEVKEVLHDISEAPCADAGEDGGKDE